MFAYCRSTDIQPIGYLAFRHPPLVSQSHHLLLARGQNRVDHFQGRYRFCVLEHGQRVAAAAGPDLKHSVGIDQYFMFTGGASYFFQLFSQPLTGLGARIPLRTISTHGFLPRDASASPSGDRPMFGCDSRKFYSHIKASDVRVALLFCFFFVYK